MPDAAWHLAKAARFEAFLDAASVIEAQHPEWIVIAHFYTVLHYVDAFYATMGHAHIGGHSRRRHLLRAFTETTTIEEAYRLLEKASQEARYEGEPFDQADLERSKRLYAEVRAGMRRALRL
jgi:hypothetical protein